MAYGSKNRSQITRMIGELSRFKVGNMKADWYPSGTAVPGGMLSPGHLEQLRSGDGMAVYVIFSYSTPIAWRFAGQPWCEPPVRYSITTSHHQGIARVGMAAWTARTERVLAEVGH